MAHISTGKTKTERLARLDTSAVALQLFPAGATSRCPLAVRIAAGSTSVSLPRTCRTRTSDAAHTQPSWRIRRSGAGGSKRAAVRHPGNRHRCDKKRYWDQRRSPAQPTVAARWPRRSRPV